MTLYKRDDDCRLKSHNLSLSVCSELYTLQEKAIKGHVWVVHGRWSAKEASLEGQTSWNLLALSGSSRARGAATSSTWLSLGLELVHGRDLLFMGTGLYEACLVADQMRHFHHRPTSCGAMCAGYPSSGPPGREA
jgi:hypothetical protein